MPWLMYFLTTSSKTKDQVLSDTGIPTKFTFPSSQLVLMVGSYSLNGTFIEFVNATNGVLQLCKNSDDYMNAAYVFGTYFTQTVSLLFCFLNCFLCIRDKFFIRLFRLAVSSDFGTEAEIQLSLKRFPYSTVSSLRRIATKNSLQYPWVDNWLMAIFSLSSRVKSCKVSQKVWLSTLGEFSTLAYHGRKRRFQYKR